MPKYCAKLYWIHITYTLRARQKYRHFADDIFKCIFLNENVWISLQISLKLVPKVRINNIPALVQIMAWRRPGDKPLSEPMMVSLPTHICVTRPQWDNTKELNHVDYNNQIWRLVKVNGHIYHCWPLINSSYQLLNPKLMQLHCAKLYWMHTAS